MSRDLSLNFRQAIYAPETGEAFIILIEISGDTLTTPIRVCSDAVNVTSNGDLYVAYPFDITMPDDIEEGAPNCRITIDNVDRALTVGIRNLISPPTVKIMVVLASDPDVIELEYDDFQLTNIVYDSMTIEGTVTVENYLAEPYPGDAFMPSTTPGMF